MNSLDSDSDNEYIKWNNKNHQYNWEIESIIGLFIGTLEGMLDFELHKWGLDLNLDLQVGNPNPSKQGVTSGIPLIEEVDTYHSIFFPSFSNIQNANELVV